MPVKAMADMSPRRLREGDRGMPQPKKQNNVLVTVCQKCGMDGHGQVARK